MQTSTILKFNAIYKQHNSAISRYVNMKIKDKMVAEELISDIFVKISINMEKYDEQKATFRTWIFNIAKNTLIDHLRKKTLVTESYDVPLFNNQSDNVHDYMPIATSDLDPLELLINNINIDKLYVAISKLNKKQRELITMYAIGGNSYKDIAEKLDMPLGTIKARIHTARLNLKEILGLNRLMVA